MAAEIFRVVYIAHPLCGKTQAETDTNRRKASILTARLSAKYRFAPVCSWIVLSEHWTEEEGRDLGLKIDCALITRCDEIWLCGPMRELTAGMTIEHDHAVSRGVEVVDRRGIHEITDEEFAELNL